MCTAACTLLQPALHVTRLLSPVLQVVHHLFPGICHLHYPAIAPIVLDTCKEFNVPYHVYPTVRRALDTYLDVFHDACPCITLHAACLSISKRVNADWQALCILHGRVASTKLHTAACSLSDPVFWLVQFVSALAAHFKHLKDMGAPTSIPSLATVG